MNMDAVIYGNVIVSVMGNNSCYTYWKCISLFSDYKEAHYIMVSHLLLIKRKCIYM